MEKMRTHLILNYLKERKSCTLDELMEKFQVSSATIHRDVIELAKRDVVERFRGGLIYRDAPSTRAGTGEYTERVVTNRRGKETAARKALTRIAEGDILFLDSSTTVYEMSLLLRNLQMEHLTIVTNSIAIIQNFRKLPQHWEMIGLGGNFDPQLNSILSGFTLEQLKFITITKAFVSAFGLDEKNATSNNERQAELVRKIVDQAQKSYLLIDRSKLGRTGLYRESARGAFAEIFLG